MVKNFYSEEEINFIKNNYKKGDDYLCKKLNRKKSSISSKRNSLGLRSPNYKEDSTWIEQEEQIIKDNYLKGDKFLKTLIPNRTLQSIKLHRLNVLGLKNNGFSVRSPIWRHRKKEIKHDFINNDLTLTEISNKYKINIETLRDNLVRSNLYNPIPRFGREFIYNKIWLKNKKSIIDDYNNGLSIKILKKKYDLNENCLRTNLEYENVYIPHTSSHIPINRLFFEKIDSPSKSYYLGLMYSDGYVSKNSYKVGIKINDLKVLQDFKRSINSQHTISEIKPKKKSHNSTYSFRVYNKKMWSDLVDKGCRPNKTYNLKFPNKNQIPSNLVIPFMYGYFDGDGHIGFLKGSRGRSMRLTFDLVGTKNLMNEFRNHLIEKLDDDYKKLYEKSIYLTERFHQKSTVPITHLLISNTFVKCKVFELLMNSYPSKMKRKIDKFLNFLKWFKENPTYERNGNNFDRYSDFQKPMIDLVKKYV